MLVQEVKHAIGLMIDAALAELARIESADMACRPAEPQADYDRTT